MPAPYPALFLTAVRNPPGSSSTGPRILASPSPTGGQKQRVANSCGFGVHPLLIPYDWRRSAQRVERADGFVAARALVAMLVVILWPAQLPCDAQRNYRYTYLV